MFHTFDCTHYTVSTISEYIYNMPRWLERNLYETVCKQKQTNSRIFVCVCVCVCVCVFQVPLRVNAYRGNIVGNEETTSSEKIPASQHARTLSICYYTLHILMNLSCKSSRHCFCFAIKKALMFPSMSTWLWCFVVCVHVCKALVHHLFCRLMRVVSKLFSSHKFTYEKKPQ